MLAAPGRLLQRQRASSSSSSSTLPANGCRRATALGLATLPRTSPALRAPSRPRPLLAELPSSATSGPPPYLIVSTAAAAASTAGAGGEARIKVIGVGGGGGNAVARMHECGLQGVELWCVNTDAQALAHHVCENRMQIGSEVTRGLGCGGNPELGRAAALESEEGLRRMVSGADLVFVTAGMGGGTGTGAAPVVARISKDAGILTVGVITSPFHFEGRRRLGQAIQGIEALRDSVDSVIVIPNDKLLEVSGAATSLTDAFSLADDVLRQGVQGISDIITVPGLVNVDFADVVSVMKQAGTAMLGVGCASGPNRAEQAALAAVSAPLIQQSVERATGIVYNITGGPDLSLGDVHRVSQVVTSLADSAANIIFGAVVDPSYEGVLHVTLIATGFSENFEEQLFNSAAGRRGRRAGSAAASSQSEADEPQAQAPPQPQQPPPRASRQFFLGGRSIF